MLNPSIHLSLKPSVPFSLYPSVYFSLNPSVHFSLYPSVQFSLYSSVHFSLYTSVHYSLSISSFFLSIHRSINRLIHPSIFPFTTGQQINLTLHDYALQNTSGDPKSHCHVYAILKERAVGKSTTLCGGRERLQQVYLSATNTVEVRILPVSPGRARYFMLEYQSEYVCCFIFLLWGTNLSYLLISCSYFTIQLQ